MSDPCKPTDCEEKSCRFKDGTKFPITYGYSTGLVDIGAYDRGIMRTLGVELQDPVIGDRPRLYTRVPGVQGTQEDKVTVVYANPEQVFSTYKIPMILIRRDSVVPALQHAFAWQNEYSVPASNAKLITKVDPLTGICLGQGYSHMETKPRAFPYDIGYTIEIWARKRLDANKILQKVLSVFPPYGNMLVVDSVGAARSYLALQEGFSEITEITDIMNRQPSYAVTITTQGELDSSVPEIRKTAQAFNITLYQKERALSCNCWECSGTSTEGRRCP